jgi:hypothetical protein
MLTRLLIKLAFPFKGFSTRLEEKIRSFASAQLAFGA